MKGRDHEKTGISGDSGDEPLDEGRREALRVVAKYAGGLAGASVVLMTPEEALAKQACSVHPNGTTSGQNCI